MFNLFKNYREYVEKGDRHRRIEYATTEFNIHRLNGIDYVTIGGTVVSRSTDTDILDRLNEFRERYINSLKKK